MLMISHNVRMVANVCNCGSFCGVEMSVVVEKSHCCELVVGVVVG